MQDCSMFGLYVTSNADSDKANEAAVRAWVSTGYGALVQILLIPTVQSWNQAFVCWLYA